MTNCALVVRGVASFADDENERLSDRAAGLVCEVRKAREGLSAAAGGESKVLSWAIRVAFRVCVERSARFNLRVSWSLRRSRRIDSGVGAEDGIGSWMSCRACQRYDLAAPGAAALVEQLAYLIMRQSHPRRQIIGDCQDIPQRIDLKLVK